MEPPIATQPTTDPRDPVKGRKRKKKKAASSEVEPVTDPSVRLPIEKLDAWLAEGASGEALKQMSRKQIAEVCLFGHHLFEAGRVQEAKVVFEGVVGLGVEDAFPHTMLGTIYLARARRGPRCRCSSPPSSWTPGTWRRGCTGGRSGSTPGSSRPGCRTSRRPRGWRRPPTRSSPGPGSSWNVPAARGRGADLRVLDGVGWPPSDGEEPLHPEVLRHRPGGDRGVDRRDDDRPAAHAAAGRAADVQHQPVGDAAVDLALRPPRAAAVGLPHPAADHHHVPAGADH